MVSTRFPLVFVCSFRHSHFEMLYHRAIVLRSIGCSDRSCFLSIAIFSCDHSHDCMIACTLFFSRALFPSLLRPLYHTVYFPLRVFPLSALLHCRSTRSTN